LCGAKAEVASRDGVIPDACKAARWLEVGNVCAFSQKLADQATTLASIASLTDLDGVCCVSARRDALVPDVLALVVEDASYCWGILLCHVCCIAQQLLHLGEAKLACLARCEPAIA
jgi:hypothetical protein